MSKDNMVIARPGLRIWITATDGKVYDLKQNDMYLRGYIYICDTVNIATY